MSKRTESCHRNRPWRVLRPGWPWAGETALLVFCIATLAAMIALLASYDHRPIFDWNGVTLNAVVALLSVAVKASLTSVAMACLGQWKWIMFSRERCYVLDFENIDHASRGPWGFFSVVARKHVSNNIKFGALIVLLTVAVDPFSQQLIQLKTVMRYEPMVDAKIARTKRYALGSLTHVHDANQTLPQVRADLDSVMEASILDGLFNEASRLGQHVTMPCAGSDCRWNPFLTSGVCYQCSDVTAQLVRHDHWAVLWHNASIETKNVSAYFLPNGAFLQNIDGDIDVTWDGQWATTSFDTSGSGTTAQMMALATGNQSKTVSMGHLKTLIWSVTAVQLNLEALTGSDSFHYAWPDLPVVANECALYYCGVEVSSSLTNNTFRETTRELDLVRSPSSYQILDSTGFPPLGANITATDSLEFDPSTAALPRSDLQIHDPQNASMSFNFSDVAVKSISSYLQQTFQTTLNLTTPVGMEDVSVALQSPDSPRGKSNMIYYAADGLPRRGYGIWNPGKSDLAESFSMLAFAMTNAMRNSQANLLNKPGDNGGEFGGPVTVYTVSWSWISLPAALVVGSIGFFVMTVRAASEAEKALHCHAWKNSSLAVISKAQELGQLFEPGDATLDLERKAALKTATFSEKESAGSALVDGR